MSTELIDTGENRDLQIRVALSAILSSAGFAASPGLSRLLIFLVEEDLSNRSEDLKETYIAHMLYHRPATYDPKLDSIVRVSVNRLRSRLQEYYADNPMASPRIELRAGSYVPFYEFNPQHSAPEEPHSARTENPTADTQEVYGKNRIPLQHAPVSFLESDESDQNSTVRLTSWRNRRWASFIISALVVGAVITITIFRKRTYQAEVWTGKPFSSLGGQEEFPAISPDGSQLAFSWTEHLGASPHIYLQMLNEHIPKRLTSSDDGESRPAWSPDGKSIAFIHVLDPNRTEVMVKSLQDGSEIKVADLHGSYPWLCTIPRLSWAPDGTKIYTSGSIGTKEPCALIALNIRTRSLQPLSQPPPGSIGDLEAAVSPDGKQVAFLRNAGTLGGDIYVASADSGAARRITFDNRDIMGFCWVPDGSGFIVSSRRQDGVPKLWRISLDGRLMRPLTDGLTLAAFPSISSQGDRIAFTTYHTTASIWKVEKESEKLLISDRSSNSTPQLSPDGRSVVYRSDRTGSFELWLSKLDGKSGIRLTDFKGPMVNNPRWSPDGSWIAFECRPQGQSDICLIRPSRPTQTRVLNRWTSNEIFPSWSSDGKSIYFTSNHSGQWEIYQQAIAGGDPIAITHDGGMRALQSPDGRWLYIFRGEDSGKLVRIPVADQPPRREEIEKPEIISSRFGPDMLGRWDVYQDGVMYLMPSKPNESSDSLSKERIISINGDTTASQIRTSVAGPSPAGDLVFSTAANGKFAVYVKQELKEGDIEFLVLESSRR